MRDIEKKLKAHVPCFIFVLLAIQPLLDVLSYWVQKMEGSSLITLALRFGILGITLLLGFSLSNRKWVYGAAIGAVALLEAGHIWACLTAPGGYQNPVPDLTNTVRIMQMPMLVLCFITFLRCEPKAFPAMQLGLAVSLGIILLVELLSRLTGTDPKTYTDGLGVLGWFSFANSQSAILCMLVPLTLGWQLSRPKRNLPLLLATAAAGLLALYLLGMRLSYLGIYAVCIGLAVSLLLIDWRAEWKMAALMAVTAILFTVLLPFSTMGLHLRSDGGAQNRRQNTIDTMITESDQEKVDSLLKKAQTSEITPEEKQWLVQTLLPVYREFIGDFVDIFGEEATMEMFGYTRNIFVFSDVRSKKLMFAEMLMRDSPWTTRVFGLDYSRFLANGRVYDVENDFHGIYYLCGAAGLGALGIFLLYFFILIVRALLKDARCYFTIEAASYGIALLICLVHAYFTAGVLRRPNVTIYLSVILAGIYYLVRIKEYGARTAHR